MFWDNSMDSMMEQRSETEEGVLGGWYMQPKAKHAGQRKFDELTDNHMASISL